MKKILLNLFLVLYVYTAWGYTYVDHGTANDYQLNNGETLCIESGTFTGTISYMHSEAEIIVKPGALFQPQLMISCAGLLINQGAVIFNNTNYFGNGFAIQNDSAAIMKILAVQNLMTFHIENKKESLLEVGYPLALINGSTVLNEGIMVIFGSLHIPVGSVLSNEGLMIINGFSNNQGIFYNAGMMRILGNFDINPDAHFSNKCSFCVKGTFINNSLSCENYGFINVYGNNENTSKFINNGVFNNNDDALVQCTAFENYNTILGSGSFVAEHTTVNAGSFGADGGGINFYDKTPTQNQIFDIQNSQPDFSVSKLAEATYDTTYVSTYCSQMVFPIYINAALPVNMLDFNATVNQCRPTLQWTTNEEKNAAYFEIQRKDSRLSDFVTIATINAKGSTLGENIYEFIDNNLENGKYQYRLKIVDIDHQFVYSKVCYAQLFCGDAHVSNLYPNPAYDKINLSFDALADEVYYVTIFDLSGKKVFYNEYNLANGYQSISIPLGDLLQGMYMLSLHNGLNRETFKFLKK